MNKRAPEMWRIITSMVDFEGKSVIDLGCGTGDFLLRAKQAGASRVVGVEMDPFTAREAMTNSGCNVIVQDIESITAEDFDIGICFSVIPYLKNPVSVMKWMYNNTRTTLIECQYFGDGPGPSTLQNDSDMSRFLSVFWDNPKPIGKTDVMIRPAERTIWLCTKS